MDEMFDMMDPDGIEDEMDAEVSKVMDELQLETFSKVSATPSGAISSGVAGKVAAPAASQEDKDVDALMKELLGA